MVIERTSEEIIIKLPARMDIDELQRLLNFLLYREATLDSYAKQEDIDKLASDLNKNWWSNNQHRFIKSNHQQSEQSSISV